MAVPEKRQEPIEIDNREIVEVWTIADPVLQVLEKIDPKDWKY